MILNTQITYYILSDAILGNFIHSFVFWVIEQLSLVRLYNVEQQDDKRENNLKGRGHSSINSVYQMSLPEESFLPQKMASESHAKALTSSDQMPNRMVFQDCSHLGCKVLFVECNPHLTFINLMFTSFSVQFQ
jgi:hypothetical protein